MPPNSSRLFVANTGPTLRLSPDLAMEIGLFESILLLQMDYLISVHGIQDEAYTWASISLRELQRICFPFWGLATIKRQIDALVEKGYLMVQGEEATHSYALGRACADLNSVRMVGDYYDPLPAAYGTAFGKPRVASVAPKAAKKTTPQASQGPNIYQAAVALAEVCQMEFEPNKPRLLKEARMLGHSSEDIRMLFGRGGAWYRLDFRGQKNSPPTPSQVRENWLKLYKVAPHPSTKVATDRGEFNV